MNNKLAVPLIVSAFITLSASALADDLDITPLSKMTGQQVLAARKAAKEHWSWMTTEERNAAILDAAYNKKHADWTAMDEYAMQPRNWGGESPAKRKDRELSTKRKRPATADPR